MKYCTIVQHSTQSIHIDYIEPRPVRLWFLFKVLLKNEGVAAAAAAIVSSHIIRKTFKLSS